RPLHITILSLGTIASSAWADTAPPAQPPRPTEAPQSTDAPLCPSQATPPPAAQAPKEGNGGGQQDTIDIDSDKVLFRGDGDVNLQGHVTVRQGDRSIKGEEIQYNSKTNALKTDSGLQYEDSVVRITGNGGNYSPSEGANFRSATFDLRQR